MAKTDINTLSAEERAIVEARRAYQREWRSKNKDKVKEHNRRFWQKKAAAASTITTTD